MSAAVAEQVDDDELKSQLQSIARLDAIIDGISKRLQTTPQRQSAADQSDCQAATGDATFLTSVNTNSTAQSDIDTSDDLRRLIAETLDRGQSDGDEQTAAATDAQSPTLTALNGFAFAVDDAARLNEIDHLLSAIAAANTQSQRAIRHSKRQQNTKKSHPRDVQLPRIKVARTHIAAAPLSPANNSTSADKNEAPVDSKYDDKLKSVNERLAVMRAAYDEKEDECADPRLMYNKVMSLSQMDFTQYIRAEPIPPHNDRQAKARTNHTTLAESDSDDDDDIEWTADKERQLEIDSIVTDSDDDDDDNDDAASLSGSLDATVSKMSALGSKVEGMLAEMNATAAAAGATQPQSRSPLPERAATGEAAVASRSRRLSQPHAVRPASAGTNPHSVGKKSMHNNAPNR